MIAEKMVGSRKCLTRDVVVANMVAALFLTANLISSVSFAAPKIGEAAPDFTLMDSDGKSQTLSAYKSKIVVLEWFNKGCPFVKKHYESSNMQTLQKKYVDKGVIWLTIASSAAGKEGFENAADTSKTRASWKIASTASLLDSKGEVGRLYQAKTTPQMFVIDAKGTLVYGGAIDSIASAEKSDIAKSENYVVSAVDLISQGKPVKTSSTKSYGCAVKY